ncbi:MAG: LysR family transcriptional regulator [Bradyrhizobium sp.]|uniref:LysR family transcriptional regulator n=1 Tax=Bradyrhizobium sp. TaxID=376 RepID=UPI001DD82ED1|nr:LysR family transcriptional regulator [Bradyrhizobium sp.]MBV9565008.1 LysR family transcriptional regulator [Bradyrhizobium sp.]
MNWDDLRIVAAVREAGTYAAAGTRLRLDETTVGRRLARIERALGVRLFEAVDGGRRPTASCERVLAHVQAMMAHAAEISRIGDSLPGLVGRFRIASTNAVAEEILAPRAARLLAAHPGIALRLLTSSENVRFSRWQADVAIRLRKPDKGDFTISRLGELKLYLIEPAAKGEAEPVVCAYPDELGQIPETELLKEAGLQGRTRIVSDNVRVIRTLIESRQAIGILPDLLCTALLSDRRLRATLLPRRRDVWLLVQNHLKRDGAARVVIDWIRDAFAEFARG